MEATIVAEAVRRVQERGQPVTARTVRAEIGHGSHRDILTHLKALAAGALLPPPAAVGDAGPVGPPAVAAMVPPPVPLLAQAQARLAAALAEERRIRRGLAEPQTPLTWDDLGRCQKATRQAQTQVDRLEQSKAHLLAQLPAARVEARRAAGAWVAAQEDARRTLARVQRQAALAHEDLERLVQDLAAIAGPQAVPGEEA
jgi:hypothetical protein